MLVLYKVHEQAEYVAKLFSSKTQNVTQWIKLFCPNPAFIDQQLPTPPQFSFSHTHKLAHTNTCARAHTHTYTFRHTHTHLQTYTLALRHSLSSKHIFDVEILLGIHFSFQLLNLGIQLLSGHVCCRQLFGFAEKCLDDGFPFLEQYIFIIIIVECFSLLSSSLTAIMSRVILNKWVYPFTAHILLLSGVLTVLFGCYMVDTTWKSCYFCTHSVCTIQLCTSLQCHFIESHIYVGSMYV